MKPLARLAYVLLALWGALWIGYKIVEYCVTDTGTWKRR